MSVRDRFRFKSMGINFILKKSIERFLNALRFSTAFAFACLERYRKSVKGRAFLVMTWTFWSAIHTNRQRERIWHRVELTDRRVDRKADRQNYLFLVSFSHTKTSITKIWGLFLKPPEKWKHLTPASWLRIESRRDRRGRNEEQLRVNKRTSKYPRKR